jgi:ElaB/YqjD/DUF883 family membrane-anchored ribosome-binding protein
MVVPGKSKERQMNKDSFEGDVRGKNGNGEHTAGGLMNDAMDQTLSAIGSAKDAVASGAQVAESEIRALQDQIAKMAQTVTQLVQNQASSVRDQVMDAVGTASDSVSKSAAVAQDALTSMEADVESRIKRNPWSAVAIAALAGLLIGKMSS